MTVNLEIKGKRKTGFIDFVVPLIAILIYRQGGERERERVKE